MGGLKLTLICNSIHIVRTSDVDILPEFLRQLLESSSDLSRIIKLICIIYVLRVFPEITLRKLAVVAD